MKGSRIAKGELAGNFPAIGYMQKRKRKLWSVKNELLTKSREAMLCSVQIFNNPNVMFKSESFIVLSTIAWTYLLHAYFREMKVDYRYYDQRPKTKRYHKGWELADFFRTLDKIFTCVMLVLMVDDDQEDWDILRDAIHHVVHPMYLDDQGFLDPDCDAIYSLVCSRKKVLT